MKNYTPRLFIVVGNPASGKDELISAVNILGSLHAEIVPKYTNRTWRAGDDVEMICEWIPDPNNEVGNYIRNENYDLEGCDIVYVNYETTYGIKTNNIWDKLQKGVSQVLVVSNKEALNVLKQKFGKLAVILYVYSQITREEYLEREKNKEKKKLLDDINYVSNPNYLRQRADNFDMTWNLYEDNFMLFDHVFIYADKEEDLFDQIFRLFRAYEKGLI